MFFADHEEANAEESKNGECNLCQELLCQTEYFTSRWPCQFVVIVAMALVITQDTILMAAILHNYAIKRRTLLAFLEHNIDVSLTVHHPRSQPK